MISHICQKCSTEFFRRKGYSSSNKYCSKKCHALSTVAGKNKNRFNFFCKFCGKEYNVPLGYIETTKYCSKLCHNRGNAQNLKLITGKNHRSYKNGIQLYRRIKAENALKKCEECGNEKNIDVHHIDENRENNDISNLKYLCRKCHKKIHNVQRDSLGRFLFSHLG